MNLLNMIRNLRRSQTDIPVFSFSPVSDGLDFVIREDVRDRIDEVSGKDQLFALQLISLKMLSEQGQAERRDYGFFLKSDAVIALDREFHSLFELPPFFNGRFALETEGVTSQHNFKAVLKVFQPYELIGARLTGPFLQVSSMTFYSLTAPQWRALNAVKLFNSVSEHSVFDNNRLIHELKGAVSDDERRAGAEDENSELPKLNLDLKHFENFNSYCPEKVGIAAESDSAGNLILSPVFGSCNADDISRRLGNVPEDDKAGVMHIKNDIVLLKPQVTHAVHKVLQRRVIPKECVKDFIASPTAFIQDVNIDFDRGFSLRVSGAELFVHKYFGDTEENESDWFTEVSSNVQTVIKAGKYIESREDLDALKDIIQDAQNVGADVIEFNSEKFTLNTGTPLSTIIGHFEKQLKEDSASDDEATEQVADIADDATGPSLVLKIKDNDEFVDFSTCDAVVSEEGFDTSFSADNLQRTPFPHQQEGIRWILSRFEQGRQSSSHVGGGLLADDMGLGKTFMTLVALEEIQKRYGTGTESRKPVLVVAPLSLIENWESEVKETFKQNPFSDIKVLQAARDLKDFVIEGAPHETKQHLSKETALDQITYALKVGTQYVPDQLDRAGRLVLTTYDTLRAFQFSLSRIDWSFVAFDEAQALKNPNTLVSRAAKALKADFKLLITGTPVENSLKDIWCLTDTALPGLLGAWQDFRTKYISPINAEAAKVKRKKASPSDLSTVKIRIGRVLREIIGSAMLRRTKEEQLSGLPQKVVFSPDSGKHNIAALSNAVIDPALGAVMQDKQLERYNTLIQSIRDAKGSLAKKITLSVLHGLKTVSIHHDLNNKEIMVSDINPADSCKLGILKYILDGVKKRNEKAVIFAISKRVQAFLALYLQKTYRISIEIVNGDTSAVSSESSGSLSRKQILDRFQNAPGFGVIILSPIAVGVGLTVTGANNVIHMERHWNPAKEAQATDRVYRIGQKKQVNVYLPMALHPEVESFDEKLNILLSKKTDLSSAVVTADDISPQDLNDLFTGQSRGS